MGWTTRLASVAVQAPASAVIASLAASTVASAPPSRAASAGASLVVASPGGPPSPLVSSHTGSAVVWAGQLVAIARLTVGPSLAHTPGASCTALPCTVQPSVGSSTMGT